MREALAVEELPRDAAGHGRPAAPGAGEASRAPTSMREEIPRGAAVFALLLAVNLLTWNGWDSLFDPESMLAVTKAILFEQSVIITEPESGRRTPSIYGLGQSLLFVPPVLAAHAVGPPGDMHIDDWERLLASLSNSVVNAATGAVLFAAARLLGLSVPRALLVGALGVLGTPLWSLTQYQMSEPLTALGVTVAALAVAAGGPPRWDFLAGAAFGIAILTRPVELAVFPALAVGWIHGIWRGPRPLDRGAIGRRLLAGALGFLPFLLLYFAYNHVRFGTLVVTSYGLARGPNVLYSGEGGILEGIGVMFFSRDVGLLWFAPIALLGLACLPLLRGRHATLALVLSGCFALHLLIHARSGLWYGGPFWGPRFLAAVLPVAVLGVAAALSRGGPFAAAVVLVGSLSMGLNLLGAIHDTVNSYRKVTPDAGMIATQWDRLSIHDMTRPSMNATSGTAWPTLTWLGTVLVALAAAASLELVRRSGRLRGGHVAAALCAAALLVAARESALPYRVLAARSSPAVQALPVPLVLATAPGVNLDKSPGRLVVGRPLEAAFALDLGRGLYRFRAALEGHGPATYELRFAGQAVASGELPEGTRGTVVTAPIHVRRPGRYELGLKAGSARRKSRAAIVCSSLDLERLDRSRFRNYVLQSE